MGEAPAPGVVQIVPNDHPPFADICVTYGQALEHLGCRVRTVVLAPPRAEPLPGARYLNLPDMKAVRTAGRAVRTEIEAQGLVLAICHRYRAYRVLRASGVRVPRVVTVAHEFGFFKRLQRRLERALFAREVLFAGVSPAVQAELGETVADPLLLPNALDLTSFDARRVSREQALAILGVPPMDGFTIGLVGRLVEKKSPALAMAALRRLVDEGHNVRLLVIGDGPLAAELRSANMDLPVVFCGFVADARRLLSALDVLLLTSQEVEAFGMVALEAMCSGIPVVAGPTPGPQFVLGSSGYYYTRREPDQVAAALLRVREDALSGTLDQRLAHARARAEREFSVPGLAARLDELLFRPVGSIE